MAVKPEIQAEYDATMQRVVLAHGSVVMDPPGAFDWVDYAKTEHLQTCGATCSTPPCEDAWYELATMSADADKYVHGISLQDVSCHCGAISDQYVRLAAHISTISEWVFTATYARGNGR